MNSEPLGRNPNPSMTKQKRLMTTIGWREWVELPDLCGEPINAKIDTGAKSSAIHAFKINQVKIDGAPYAEFYLHPVQRHRYPEIFCRAPIVDKRIVRSSNGQEEERLAISTRLRLAGRLWKIELTLTNRDAMGFRMLVGRDALRRKFLVNPSGSYLAGEGFHHRGKR